MSASGKSKEIVLAPQPYAGVMVPLTGFDATLVKRYITEKPTRFVGRRNMPPVDLKGYRGDSAR